MESNFETVWQSFDSLLQLVTVAMLRANRKGHTSRAIGAAIALQVLLQSVLRMLPAERVAKRQTLLPKLVQASEG